MISNFFGSGRTGSLPSRTLRAHYQPWPLRLVASLLIAAEAILPFNSMLVAAGPPPVPESSAVAAGPKRSDPPLVLTPQNVTVNRTAPQVEPPPPRPVFSEVPTEREIFRARVFAEPLVPMGAPTSPVENSALATTLLNFLDRGNNDQVGGPEQFLRQFPTSPWRASLLVNLGIVYRKTGYFSKALTAWEEAWTLSKNQTEPKAKAMADRAISDLLELNARLGRFDRLEALFNEVEGRDVRGPATEKVSGARAGLWLMRNHPELAFRCGPMALDRIRAFLDPADAFDDRIRDSKSTLRGLSLGDVLKLANDLGMDYQMAKRVPGTELILPAVVHWKVDHYAAVIKEENGSYLIKDPTFGEDIWVSQAALEAEASGYFLTPGGPLPGGWQAVDAEEGGTVWGKGYTSASDVNRNRPEDPKCAGAPGACCSGGGSGGGGPGPGPSPGPSPAPSPSPSPAPSGGGGGPPGKPPMAQYAMHAMLVSLNIFDTPVGYTPPRGPVVEFTVTYNQREANQPSVFTYSNLGNKWTFDWLAYVTDDPGNPTANANYFLSGGGTEPYSNFNSGTQSYAPQTDSRTVLTRTSTNSYERRFPDGSKQIFGLPDGASAFPRKIFMTQYIDRAGNAVTYAYDNSFRMVSVADALNQITTLNYGSTNSADALFYKITKVTDPFGRYASFDYNGSGQLIKITDIIGITSEFTYAAGDFITSLKTPYGTTRFSMGETGRNRTLEATDPMGAKERMEYVDTSDVTPDYEPTELLPPVPYLYNGHLKHRNSYFWDKKAMQLYPGDYSKAKIYHWAHTENLEQASGTIESIKPQLEGRVWYTYGGQGLAYAEGTNGLPATISRVLDDGFSQIYKYEYNSIGKPTSIMDPMGRVTTNIYSTNLIDLLEVRQVAGSGTELLASYTYNSQHLPVIAVDAAGQTNALGYNSNGQLAALTNAHNEIVSLVYDSDGYLTNITESMAGTSTTFTYDGYGRIRTVTDAEGYTVTRDYDAADRPTKITHPDNTFEQLVYDRLDLVMSRDRRGHWTYQSYDALQRITDIQDALGRLTHLEWCACGSLESLTDPLNRTTTWIRDLRGRIQTKVYPDNTRIDYTYENYTSRLRKATDARNQSKVYDYFVDNNLKQIAYTNAVVATPTVAFTYDTNFNRLITMIDGNGVTTYSYYAVTNGQLGAGNLQAIDGPWSNDTVTYAYDVLGRVTSRGVNGILQAMTFDALGRVTVVTNALGSFTNSYLNTSSQLASMTYPNGQVTALTYYGNTNNQRLQTIWNKNPTGGTSSKFDYTYELDGQLATWTQTADTNTIVVYSLEYDMGDQLLSATVRDGSTSAVLKEFGYAYDRAGNRTTEQIFAGTPNSTGSLRSGAFNPANQLTSVVAGGPMRFKGNLSELGTVLVGGTPATIDSGATNFQGFTLVSIGTNVVPVVATDYSGNSRTNNYQIVVTNAASPKILLYDVNGNLSSMTSSDFTNLYEWDAADRLTAIETKLSGSLVRSEIAYDGLGRRTRIIERENGSTVSASKFLWIGSTLCEERDSGGGTVIKRFFRQGEQIYGTNYFFTKDHLGSVREVIDTSGEIRARYDYDPYGRRSQLSGSFSSDLAFTGHYFHGPSQLYLTPYRAYDPDTARWLSKDPLGERGGLNLYGYGFNEPINSIDMNGLDVYELRRTAHACGGSLDHTFIFIDDTGLTDNAGRPLNYVVDFNDDGEKVNSTPFTLEEYLKNGKQKDPDLRVCQRVKTSRKESRKLVEYFQRTSPLQKYHWYYNCRTTFPRANEFLWNLRNPGFIKPFPFVF